LCVVTNKAGIGIRIYFVENLQVFLMSMCDQCKTKEASIDAICFSLVHPTEGKAVYLSVKVTRKVDFGIFNEATKYLKIWLSKSAILGGKLSYMMAISICWGFQQLFILCRPNIRGSSVVDKKFLDIPLIATHFPAEVTL
jgi:histidinol phosphatase-like enzyme